MAVTIFVFGSQGAPPESIASAALRSSGHNVWALYKSSRTCQAGLRIFGILSIDLAGLRMPPSASWFYLSLSVGFEKEATSGIIGGSSQRGS